LKTVQKNIIYSPLNGQKSVTFRVKLAGSQHTEFGVKYYREAAVVEMRKKNSNWFNFKPLHQLDSLNIHITSPTNGSAPVSEE